LLYWEREQATRPHSEAAVRYGFHEGQQQTWEGC
jgi:hypothetical protein